MICCPGTTIRRGGTDFRPKTITLQQNTGGKNAHGIESMYENSEYCLLAIFGTSQLTQLAKTTFQIHPSLISNALDHQFNEIMKLCVILF